MRHTRVTIFCVSLLSLIAGPSIAEPQQAALDAVSFQQRIGEPLAADLRFNGADCEPISLHSLAQNQPLVLVMSWYDCPHLCPMVLGHLARAASELPFPPEQYEVAVVSIDPGETSNDARKVRAELRRAHGDIVNTWHLLTGERMAIKQLARNLGFQYAYDAKRDRYAHPAGVVVINPGGQIGRYLLGLRPAPTDLKLALVEAGEGRLGSPVEQLALRCYRFDPESGKYNFAIIGALRWLGGAFFLGMMGVIFWLRRKEHS